jgi:ketosteroid isomerase-like protein
MSDERATDLDVLLAAHRCRTLVLRAATCADAGDADGLAALFTADAELVRPGGRPIRGREAIAAAYRERPADRLTVHLVCGTLFEACSGDRASATSRVLLWSADGRGEAGPFGRAAAPRQVVGRFRDTFVHTDEGWRIARRHASFELFRDA